MITTDKAKLADSLITVLKTFRFGVTNRDFIAHNRFDKLKD